MSPDVTTKTSRPTQKRRAETGSSGALRYARLTVNTPARTSALRIVARAAANVTWAVAITSLSNSVHALSSAISRALFLHAFSPGRPEALSSRFGTPAPTLGNAGNRETHEARQAAKNCRGYP